MTNRELTDGQSLQRLLRLAEEDEEFAELEVKRQRFLASMAVLGGNADTTVVCKLAGIPYGARARRDSIKDGLWEKHGVDLLALMKIVKAPGPNVTGPTDEENDMAVLDTIIHGNARDGDKVRALEAKLKILETRNSSKTMKPFERIWLEVMIPNMLEKDDKDAQIAALRKELSLLKSEKKNDDDNEE